MPHLTKADKVHKTSANEARRRKETALAEIREMELAERKGLLIPQEEVKQAWGTILSQVKTAVLRIPSKCAPAVAAVDDPRECRAILAVEVEQVLKDLADNVQRLSLAGNRRSGKRTTATAAPTAQ